MPRVPRNPGAGKAPHNGPARGTAASGSGSGSWATGQSAGGLRRFTPETARAAVAKRDDPEAQAIRDATLAAALNTYAAVMERDDQPQAQIAAAAKLLERVEGPIETKLAAPSGVTLAVLTGVPRADD